MDAMGMLDDLKKMHDDMQNYMQERELDKRISENGSEYKMYNMSLKGFPYIYPSDLFETFRRKVTDTYNQRMEILSEISNLEKKKKNFLSCGCMSVGVFIVAAGISCFAKSFYAVPVIFFSLMTLLIILGFIFSSKIKELKNSLTEKEIFLDLNYVQEDYLQKFKDAQKSWMDVGKSDAVYLIENSEEIEDRVKERTSAGTRVDRTRLRSLLVDTTFVNSSLSPIVFKSSGNGYIQVFPGIIIAACDNPNYEPNQIRVYLWSDLIIDLSSTRFIEKEYLPKDANVIDYTYKYANLDGSRDMRYNDNTKIPIAKYEEISVSTIGCKTAFHISNESFALKFIEKMATLVS